MTRMKFFFAVLLISLAATVSAIEPLIEWVNGKPRLVSTNQQYGLGVFEKHRAIGKVEKLDPESGNRNSGRQLFENTAVIIKTFTAGLRAEEAVREAKVKAKEAVETSGAQYAMVPVLIDRPKRFPTTPEEITAYVHTVGEAKVANSKVEVLNPVLGSGIPELEPSSPRRPQTYLDAVVIAERDRNGKIDSRLVTPADIEQHVIDRTKQIEEDSRKRYEELRRELETAEQARQKTLEESAKKKKDAEELAAEAAEHQQKQKERERLAEEEKKKEEQARKSREELDRKFKERDKVCENGGTVICRLVDQKLTNEIEQLERFHNTAMCKMTEEPITTGPCAGPRGCIYCSVSSQLREAERKKARFGIGLARAAERQIWHTGKVTINAQHDVLLDIFPEEMSVPEIR